MYVLARGGASFAARAARRSAPALASLSVNSPAGIRAVSLATAATIPCAGTVWHSWRSMGTSAAPLSDGSSASRPIKFNMAAKGVEFSWGDETVMVPFVWLRDHCRCPECYNDWTFQRQVDTMSIPADIFPVAAELVDNQQAVKFVWPDGHVSTFTSEWLYNCGLNGTRDKKTLWGTVGYETQVLWDGETFKKTDKSLMPSVDFEHANGSDEGLYEYLNKVRTYGFCLMKNVPAESDLDTENMARRLALVRGTFYGEFYENRIIPDGNDTAYSDIKLPAHTDGCYWNDQPGLQLWHCHTPADTGGATLLVDGFNVGKTIRENHPETFKYFCEKAIPFGFRDREHMLRNYDRVFTLDDAGNLIHFRYNNDDRAVLSDWSCDEITEFYEHLRVLLRETRNPKNEVWCLLEKGDLLTINNRRVMHGRSGFEANSGRYLRGCYHNFEDYFSKLRMLEHKLGIADHDALV